MSVGNLINLITINLGISVSIDETFFYCLIDFKINKLNQKSIHLFLIESLPLIHATLKLWSYS